MTPRARRTRQQLFSILTIPALPRSPFIRRAPVYVGLSAAKDRLVLSLTEITSSVWVADVTGRYRR